MIKRIKALWDLGGKLVSTLEDEVTAKAIVRHAEEVSQKYARPQGMAKIVDMSTLDDFGEEQKDV